MEYSITNLKTKKEYQEELHNLYEEISVGLATDTLIKDDLKMLTRIDEIVIIIDFIEKHKVEVKKDVKEQR